MLPEAPPTKSVVSWLSKSYFAAGVSADVDLEGTDGEVDLALQAQFGLEAAALLAVIAEVVDHVLDGVGHQPAGSGEHGQVDVGHQLLVQPVDERLGVGQGVELVALGDAGADPGVALGALAAEVGADLPVEGEVDAERAVRLLDDAGVALDAQVDPGDVQFPGQLVVRGADLQIAADGVDVVGPGLGTDVARQAVEPEQALPGRCAAAQHAGRR